MLQPADTACCCRLEIIATTPLEESCLQPLSRLSMLHHLDIGGFQKVTDATIQVQIWHS